MKTGAYKGVYKMLKGTIILENMWQTHSCRRPFCSASQTTFLLLTRKAMPAFTGSSRKTCRCYQSDKIILFDISGWDPSVWGRFTDNVERVEAGQTFLCSMIRCLFGLAAVLCTTRVGPCHYREARCERQSLHHDH